MKQLDRKAKFLLATNNKDALIGAGYSLRDLRGAGYSASDLIGAGYSASDLTGAGYSASDLIGAGYSLSALIGAGYSASDLRCAGYSASDLIGAGYSLRDLRGAGYSARDLRGAGYSLSDLIGAGYSASDLIGAGYSLRDLRGAGYSLSALIGAGYSASDLRGAGYSLRDLRGFDSITKLSKPYTRLLADINSEKRTHKQSTFGPEYCPKKDEVCGTNMCTAGHLVHMAYLAGWKEAYVSVKENGWATTAGMIHYKAHPNHACQNFGSIPQDWAMAYIEEMAEIEKKAV